MTELVTWIFFTIYTDYNFFFYYYYFRPKTLFRNVCSLKWNVSYDVNLSNRIFLSKSVKGCLLTESSEGVENNRSKFIQHYKRDVNYQNIKLLDRYNCTNILVY